MIKKYLVKTITYRLFTSVITISLSILIGVPLELVYLLSGIELIVKPVIYFVHEVIWGRGISENKSNINVKPKIILNEEEFNYKPREVKRLSYTSNR
jgi:uncharacterized membrane protein